MADNGWMYNERVSATEKTDEWTRKTHFLVNELARGTKGLVRALCPCVRCVKRQRRGKDEMYRHLLQYGYMHGYVTEIDFDERERDRGEVMRQRLNGNAYDGIRDFLDDLVHADVPDSPPEPEAPPEPEEPEPTAKAFYDMIAAAKRPLYEGAAISQLDAISQCLADKTRYNTTREGFEASLKTTGNMLPKDHCLPQSLHATRRIMKDLNMDYQRIDCCPKGCVLFWRQYAEDKYCPICKQSRYEEVTGKDGQVRQSSTAKSILRYLPFIKRIQRLYMHEETAKQMTWHKYGKRFVDENKKLKMGHPSDGTAWKNFDTKHRLKAAEARNVRIAIATDGFNPYGMSNANYSCWPVFVIPLNLPPGVLMTRKTMFLSLIIPGPHYPGKNLSVYMQPIVEDLNHSWHHGTLTYDRASKTNFCMRVWLQYTMHDMPGYALTCGWCTAATPTGHQFEGYGVTHNWTHEAALTKLEYYKDLELPHNIDVMHTVKNVAESVFHTCLNIPGKSKDNVKARVDIEILCDREKLHMKRPIGRQKNWFKPHANFCLDSIQKKEAFRWLKYVVMFPDGYCSNMSKGVNLSTGKVTGLKSHDYHIWIQRLMPVMLRGYIPEKVWRVLAQLSHFFRTLCAKQICPEVIAKLQHTVPELLCNLEMIFPPGFFTPMAHLIVHLANEALLGGPVQFRWQFCIEREFKYIRKITGNKAKIEACIAEAICLREMADAATTYYPDDVPTQHNPVTRYNVDVPENDPKLKLFQFPGGKAGKGTKYKLENEEKDCIMLYVLMNMEEVIPFVSEFTDEMWPYDELPETSEMDTLLKDGAPGINKNFVTWFMEKGRERNVDMIDELKCVSQGCSREVTKYEKYDVNGFRFHTETHQKGRANPKTINTGVFTKGANNFDYYGRLQSVYELTFNRTNVQLNIVVFKCHWFDPIGGQRSDKSIGLVEVKPSTTYSGADVFIVAHQAKQVYYLPYPCQKAELKGWEVVFQVSPHGNLPIPSEDDYNNIDPVTYEGIFYQEEQDFGEYILEPFVQEDLGNDAETRGESVVDLKDISMLEKLLEANDNYDEPPPVDPSTLYSQDSDSDSGPEKEKEKEMEYESERESDDGCGKADSESLLKTLAQVKRNIPRVPRRSDRAPVQNPRYADGTDGGRGRGGRGGGRGRGRGGRGGGRGGGGVHMDFDEPPSASGDVAPELYLEGPSSGEVEMETESTHESDSRAELEVMEGEGAPKPLKLRGEARVPDARKEPKTHDDKALIIPSSDDNWTWDAKPPRMPNSLLGALIKKFWPGRYTPLSTVPGGPTKLATTWADYEDAPAVGFATAAEAVTTKFWCFYRVDPEHDTQARLTLRGACERLTPQQWYNQKFTSASAFWANKGKRVKKEYYVGNEPTEEWAMTIEEYMSVCPEWAEQHREAWEELIRARWLRQDEEFAAVSRRNMENRGTGGTHCAGNRDYTRFKGKKVAEAPPGVVLHDAQIYDMMRTKKKPNPALPQPQYYGNAKAAKEDYCDMVKSRHPEVDDPLSIPVDEESLVLSGHGRPHGRFPWLNKAVKPTHSTSYTRLKHTLTADSPQPRPRPARPPAYDPEFEAAFEACNEAYQQAAAQWNRQNTAYMAYIGEMMISMSTGTPPPARVTVAGDMPIMPSRAAFAATYYGSTPEVYAEGLPQPDAPVFSPRVHGLAAWIKHTPGLPSA
ncbi:hypothetical protein QYE76_070990 [Lolium multiflorum]|uniref:Transposon protein, putative, CACTA, En/Spm sub-class n=1 Tax=Lolium multiflorum TaxID=4521 RepID=A0AAD8SIX3_LOLMU|nr:hypothetical protein QYE76_070990 [Lolium multiflorum]